MLEASQSNKFNLLKWWVVFRFSRMGMPIGVRIKITTAFIAIRNWRFSRWLRIKTTHRQLNNSCLPIIKAGRVKKIRRTLSFRSLCKYNLVQELHKNSHRSINSCISSQDRFTFLMMLLNSWDKSRSLLLIIRDHSHLIKRRSSENNNTNSSEDFHPLYSLLKSWWWFIPPLLLHLIIIIFLTASKSSNSKCHILQNLPNSLSTTQMWVSCLALAQHR